MKKENILVIVLICTAVAGVLFYQYSQDQKNDALALQSAVSSVGPGTATGIGWEEFSSGMANGKKLDKPIFLYFYADWCTYCKKLKKTTFRDKAVLKYLSRNFVSISINTDKNKVIANQWRVTGLPTLWFLNSNGEKISNIPGYVDADQFIQFLKYVNTKSYETKKFNEFVKTL